MPDHLPIACSLSAGELPARRAEMASLGRDALTSAETAGPRSVLRFRAEDGVRDRLESFVAAESECCPFFDLALHDEPGAVVLTVQAPEDAEPVLAELVAAFEAAESE
jgi:hypothetical protein